MDINPLIVIPTFWTRGEKVRSERAATEGREGRQRSHGSRGDSFDAANAGAPFSHPTALDNPHPPLADCLTSLSRVQGVGRIALLVATTDSAIDVRADERVREIAAAFPHLNISVFGSVEVGSLFRRLEQLELGTIIEALSIKSYGAVRNLGLIVASILCENAVVFIDDDEIIDHADFLARALFGIGHPIHSGGYLFAKSGLITDMTGDYYQAGGGQLRDDKDPLPSLAVPKSSATWADAFWRQQDALNKAIQIALKPPRLHRSTMAFGGCMVIHREMFSKIAFDPWIMRGEDVDYVINARLHGGDVYLDDQWTIRHNSPATDRGPAARFRQNIYRFIYEHRKLEFAKSQVDLAQVTAQSLMPYPGSLLTQSVGFQALITGLLHTIAGPERGQYWRSALDAFGKANAYARKNCVNYFALQRMWSHTMEKLSCDVALQSLFTGQRSVDRSALTGSFKALS